MEPALVHGNSGIDHVATQRSEPRQDALLVRASGLGVSDHVRTENRRNLPGLAHGASLRLRPDLAQGTGRSRPIYERAMLTSAQSSANECLLWVVTCRS